MLRKKIIRKRIPIALLLALLFSLIFATSISASDPENKHQLVTDFLEDIVQLDLGKYDVELENSFVRNWDWLGGLSQTNEAYYISDTGNGGTSVLTANFRFINGTLTACSLSKNQEGTIQYSEKASSNVEAATAFLTRYQSYSGDSSINAMQNTLIDIDASKNATLTANNIALKVTNSKFGTTFSWGQTFNGAVYSGLSASFENGGLYAFSDDRSFYRIGSTDVNVVRDQAISIATSELGNFSYVYADEVVTGFSLADSNISAVLNTRGKTNPLEWYPYWSIDFPLSKMYPGSVAFIEVLVWADTGEVFEIRPMGYGGLVDDLNTTPTATPLPTSSVSPTPTVSPPSPSQETEHLPSSPSPSQSTIITTTKVIILVAAVMVASVALMLVLARRRSL